MRNFFSFFLFVLLIDQKLSQELICKEDQACFGESKDIMSPFTNISDIKLTNFSSLVIFSRKPPLEFIDNIDGNPFPLVHIDIFFNEMMIKSKLFVFLYKTGKKINIKNSYLEGDYKFQNLTIVCLINDTEINEKYIIKAKILEEFTFLKRYVVEFHVNKYIDLFSNVFDVKVRENTLSYKGDKEENYAKLIDLYHKQFKDYYDICNEIRMYDKTTAKDYRIKQLKNENNKNKYIQMDMDIIDWLHYVDKLNEVGSICTSVKGDIKKEIDCLNQLNNDCSILIKVEKLKDQFYQFHFFTRGQFSYIKITLHTIDNKVKYEIICDRYANETKHNLVTDDTKNVNNLIKSFNGTKNLIYSLTEFMYCGFFMPINVPFDLVDETLEFNLNENTIVEVEAGVFHEDNVDQKVKRLYYQFNLDLTFNFVYSDNDNYKLVIIILVFIMSILCIIVACCIIKKYQSLSRKLTEVGSRFSNSNITSKFSGASNISRTSNFSSTSGASIVTNSNNKNNKLNTNLNNKKKHKKITEKNGKK